MANGTRRCPRHPASPVDECGACEALITRAELERDDPPDESQAEQERYERWLESGRG